MRISGSVPSAVLIRETPMPIVKSYKRRGKRVRGYYRVNSVWNFWFGLLLLVVLFALYRGNR
jgi:hypothetical protein